MNLILTDPMAHDVQAFYDLTNEESIKAEFPNFKNNSIEVAKKYIDYFIGIMNDNRNPCFLRLIKLTKYDTEESIWNESNSKLIGFIVLHDTAAFDKFFSGGFDQMLSFALSETRRNKGIMTMALKMATERMVERGYNLVPSVVKGHNVASMRVLTKCGFSKVRSTPNGNIFVKRLSMSKSEFEQTFDI